MQKTELPSTKTSIRISVRDLERFAKSWLLDSEIRQLSPGTIANRSLIISKFVWFLKQNEIAECGTLEVREFLAYVSNGHDAKEGRFGNDSLRRKVKPSTVHMYFARLRTFFGFLILEGAIDVSPMEALRPPVCRPDQIQPFSQEQAERLVNQAKRSTHPRRDEAIVLFLLDTGVRASELCGVQMKDMDLQGRRCNVLGKGGKVRAIYFGRDTTRALWQYLKESPREPEEFLFVSDRGTCATDPLTRSGLLQLIVRLGRAAKIEATRCSPHTFRHTFAIEFLRAGGNIFSLMNILGHTDMKMTNKYVALAQADIANQHRQFSPADRLRGSRR